MLRLVHEARCDINPSDVMNISGAVPCLLAKFSLCEFRRLLLSEVGCSARDEFPAASA